LIRVGHGFDAHRLAAGRRLVLGGVTIPSERGALGHSDGDALAHAVSDALLGAAGLGDLGERFPSSDPQWKDADSMMLLERCLDDVISAGYRFGNLDATIVVQHPRISPHVQRIRESLANRIGVDLDRISVKAKTSDEMGYTGDGTGIAVYAVALIETR
jgi:2-C-methyl-D-erythritol 2,4-cyclodiphosphate synthase